MRIKPGQLVALGKIFAATFCFSALQTDEFIKKDIQLWESEYQAMVKKGR